jgi:hypothetical protein
MLIEERRRKQNILNTKINDLSKKIYDDPIDIRKIALSLNDIYSEEFRHSYSEFFPVILQINKSDEGNLDYLAANIESLREYVENDYVTGKNEFIKIHNRIDKLCDHLNLEISRVRVSSENEEKTTALSKKLENTQVDLNASATTLDEATKKAEKMQIDLISVLSIFSAIVIAFSGSITVLGSAIIGIKDTYICKMLLVLLVCGLILFNTIFLLLYMIGKIIGKSVLVDCESEQCNCQDNGKPKCSILKKFYRRFPYVFYFNLLTLILMAIDATFWAFDRFCF